MREPSRVGRRVGTWTIVLLTAMLLIAGLLAWQAVRSDRARREMATDIVRDYARIAASELLSRTRNDLTYYGALPSLRAFSAYRETHGETAIPSTAELSATAGPRQKEALVLAEEFFVYDSRTGECASRTDRGRAGCDVLRNVNLAKVPAEEIFRRVDPTLAIAFSTMAANPNAALGFVVNERAIGTFFTKAFDRARLLPQVLYIGNASLEIEVVDAAGAVVFHTPRRFDVRRGDIHREREGVLDGMTARVSIGIEAPPRLVAGGVPQSQLPFYLTALGVSLVLAVATVVQVHRERALAAMRSDFVASVTHELRTPLTQIRMFAETLLLARVRSDAEERRSLEIIDQEARRLSQLVDNVLKMTQSERGKLRIAPRAIDLAALVRETVERFAPLARAGGSTVEVQADGEVEVVADPESLRQVLVNLLDNAVKYGVRGQRITVSLLQREKDVVIAVEDEGPGIPKGERERIFDRYARLARDREGAAAGSGIGLSVVSDLVASHGGTVVAGEGSGGGARFVVTIPHAESGRTGEVVA